MSNNLYVYSDNIRRAEIQSLGLAQLNNYTTIYVSIKPKLAFLKKGSSKDLFKSKTLMDKQRWFDLLRAPAPSLVL